MEAVEDVPVDAAPFAGEEPEVRMQALIAIAITIAIAIIITIATPVYNHQDKAMEVAEEAPAAEAPAESTTDAAMDDAEVGADYVFVEGGGPSEPEAKPEEVCRTTIPISIPITISISISITISILMPNPIPISISILMPNPISISIPIPISIPILIPISIPIPIPSGVAKEEVGVCT